MKANQPTNTAYIDMNPYLTRPSEVVSRSMSFTVVSSLSIRLRRMKISASASSYFMAKYYFVFDFHVLANLQRTTSKVVGSRLTRGLFNCHQTTNQCCIHRYLKNERAVYGLISRPQSIRVDVHFYTCGRNRRHAWRSTRRTLHVEIASDCMNLQVNRCGRLLEIHGRLVDSRCWLYISVRGWLRLRDVKYVWLVKTSSQNKWGVM